MCKIAGDTNMAILAELTSDAVLDTAYDWLCKRRRNYPADADVWSFRQQWPVEKGRLKAELFRAKVDKREPHCRSHRLQRVSVLDHFLPTNAHLFVGEFENGGAKIWLAFLIGETAKVIVRLHGHRGFNSNTVDVARNNYEGVCYHRYLSCRWTLEEWWASKIPRRLGQRNLGEIITRTYDQRRLLLGDRERPEIDG